MNDQTCPYCAANSGIYDDRKLCCASRFIASLPTRASMAKQAEVYHRRHGHALEDLRREVTAILRRRAEATTTTVANR